MDQQRGEENFNDLVELLISNTPVGYIVLDKQYHIHYMNDYFMKMRNLTKENTLGRHCYDLSNGGVKCAVCALEGAINTGIKQKVTRKDILPNGEVRFVEDYAIPLYNDEGTDFEYLLEIMVNRTSEMQYREQLEQDYISLIRSLITLLEAKDEYTATHSRNVGNLSKSLAKAMNLSSEQVADIEIAAILHDIGKVNIPYNIINKPGKLNDEEFATIKQHPGNSYVILQQLSGFPEVKDYVRYHHERLDGRGYPEGLKSDEIPLGARVISIADTYDAMTSTRSYRTALTHEVAMDEIKRNAGTQFDPRMVEVFLDLDFSQSNDENIHPKKNRNLVERQLFESAKVTAGTKDADMAEVGEVKAFEKIISDNKFVEEIFANTPVSYVLLSPEYDVIYASPHFLSTFHLSMGDVRGKKCFDASGTGRKCPGCPMARAVEENRLVQDRLVQNINNETRYFDCFALPYHNADGELKYVLEILLDRTEEHLLRKEHENDLANIVSMLSDLLAVNNHAAHRKSKFVLGLCDYISRSLAMDDGDRQQLEMAATLCDIGMISLSDVDMDEEEKTRTHPVVAYNILESLSAFKEIAAIIKHHHEQYNGSGFPDGLAGDEIPLGSRIICLADAYYELLKKDPENASEILGRNENNAFDPALVQILLKKLNADQQSPF